MVCVCGWQIKLCGPVVTHRPYLSPLENSYHIIIYMKHYTYPHYFTLLREISLVCEEKSVVEGFVEQMSFKDGMKE